MRTLLALALAAFGIWALRQFAHYVGRMTTDSWLVSLGAYAGFLVGANALIAAGVVLLL